MRWLLTAAIVGTAHGGEMSGGSDPHKGNYFTVDYSSDSKGTAGDQVPWSGGNQIGGGFATGYADPVPGTSYKCGTEDWCHAESTKQSYFTAKANDEVYNTFIGPTGDADPLGATRRAENSKCKGKCDGGKWDTAFGDSSTALTNVIKGELTGSLHSDDAATVARYKAARGNMKEDESACNCGRAKFCAKKFEACWRDPQGVVPIVWETCKTQLEAPDDACTDAEIKSMTILKGCFDQHFDRYEEFMEDDLGCEEYTKDCSLSSAGALYAAALEDDEGILEEDYEFDGCGAFGMPTAWVAAFLVWALRF